MRATWVIALFTAGSALAQPAGKLPAYEAASLKLNNSGVNGQDIDGTPGQIVFKNTSVERLIEVAYSVGPHRVVGPAWMAGVRVDIAAKYPPDASEPDRSLMLRSLLADRFQLAAHPETRDMPGYALVVAKGGCKLKPVEPHENDTSTSGGRVRNLVAKSTNMATLANLAARYVDAPVADKTGLDGVYDFEMRWTRDDESTEASDVPTIFDALQETLGLRLQPRKVAVQVIVVDHLERVPTEN